MDKINFEYDIVHEAKWEEIFERLNQYHSAKGNCRVPSRHDQCGGPSLGAWVLSQRSVPSKVVRGNPNYVERKRLLDTHPFEYDKVDDANWNSMFDVLKKYNSEHGHCEVPLAYVDNGDDVTRAALG